MVMYVFNCIIYNIHMYICIHIIIEVFSPFSFTFLHYFNFKLTFIIDEMLRWATFMFMNDSHAKEFHTTVLIPYSISLVKYFEFPLSKKHCQAQHKNWCECEILLSKSVLRMALLSCTGRIEDVCTWQWKGVVLLIEVVWLQFTNTYI